MLLGKLVRALVLASHLRRMVTMNNGVLLKVEQVVILFGMTEIGVVLFDHGLFMITLDLVCGSVHLVVHESLPLEEVLPPLLLLNELL